MSGTKNHPINCPMHHITGFSENARTKFSVPREKSIVRNITLTLSFGFGRTVGKKLPTTMAIPEHAVTIPKTLFPAFGITSAGSTASNADAIRLTPDMNNITWSIIGVFFKKTSPSFARVRTLPSEFALLLISGILTKNNSEKKATAKVRRSTAITTSSPASA